MTKPISEKTESKIPKAKFITKFKERVKNPEWVLKEHPTIPEGFRAVKSEEAKTSSTSSSTSTSKSTSTAESLEKKLTRILDKYFPDQMDSQMYHPNMFGAVEDIIRLLSTQKKLESNFTGLNSQAEAYELGRKDERVALAKKVAGFLDDYFRKMAKDCFSEGSVNGKITGDTHFYQLYGNELRDQVLSLLEGK